MAIGVGFNDDLGAIEAKSAVATGMENRIGQLFHANVAKLDPVLHQHGRLLLLVSFYQHLDCPLFLLLFESAFGKVGIHGVGSGVFVS